MDIKNTYRIFRKNKGRIECIGRFYSYCNNKTGNEIEDLYFNLNSKESKIFNINGVEPRHFYLKEEIDYYLKIWDEVEDLIRDSSKSNEYKNLKLNELEPKNSFLKEEIEDFLRYIGHRGGYKDGEIFLEKTPQTWLNSRWGKQKIRIFVKTLNENDKEELLRIASKLEDTTFLEKVEEFETDLYIYLGNYKDIRD